MVILLLIIALIAVWNTTTLYGFTIERNLARKMAKTFDGMEIYMRMGVGGFGYVYAIVCGLPIFLGAVLRHLKKFQRPIRIVLIYDLVSSLYLIIKAGYAIAVITAIIGIFITLFYKRTNKCRVVIFLLTILGIILIINSADLLTLILPFVYGTMYEQKVNDMILSLSGGDAVGTVYLRLERYTRSLKYFFESPFWGQLSFMNIGKHSAIIDKFAQFGVIIGSIFTYYITYAQRKLLQKRFDDGIAAAMLIVTTMTFLLNNLAWTEGVIIFVLYPLSSKFIASGISESQAVRYIVRRADR